VWYDRFITERHVAPCVSACLKEGIKELFFCLWGDDGAYCEFDSALAGVAFAAARAFGESDDSLRARHQAVCGIGYDEVLAASELDVVPRGPFAQPSLIHIDRRWVRQLLWDDPVTGLHWLRTKAECPSYWAHALRHYRRVARKLSQATLRGAPDVVRVGQVVVVPTTLRVLVAEVLLVIQARDLLGVKRGREVAEAAPAAGRDDVVVRTEQLALAGAWSAERAVQPGHAVVLQSAARARVALRAYRRGPPSRPAPGGAPAGRSILSTGTARGPAYGQSCPGLISSDCGLDSHTSKAGSPA